LHHLAYYYLHTIWNTLYFDDNHEPLSRIGVILCCAYSLFNNECIMVLTLGFLHSILAIINDDIMLNGQIDNTVFVPFKSSCSECTQIFDQ